jgi:ankyrin repeat protein
VNARDWDGWTPLHSAASRNIEPEVIRVLVQLGAEIDARDRRSWTPLHHAAAFNPNYDVVLALLELGADHRATTKETWSAWFLIHENEALMDTPAYRRLRELKPPHWRPRRS